MNRRDKVREAHLLKKEGYADSQIADMLSISRRTVRRRLTENPENICVDGTKTRKSHRRLDPFRDQILEMIERGFQPTQILRKLRESHPDISIKRTTLSDFCVNLRAELFDSAQSQAESPKTISDGSILAPHVVKISEMLADNKPVTVIFTTIKADGYSGSYSLLQQYCRSVKPVMYIKKKSMRKVKRRELTTVIWSGGTDLSDQDMSYIEANYPILLEIKGIIAEFRTAYGSKDIEAVKLWADKYSGCDFPAICSFINGISDDTDAFYNSLRYEYSNGLLEGSVNKLKAIKRSMYGRASYLLLRAKLLLNNGTEPTTYVH